MNIEKKIYPDGTFYPLITDITEYESLVFNINNYSDLWYLNQIKDVLDYNKCSCDLIIPNLLDAQADRRFTNNSSFNLKLVCEFLNNMKWDIISIFHPHNPEVVEALINNVKIIDNSEFILNVLKELYPDKVTQVYTIGETYKRLNEDFNYDDLILMSSDAGGFKPLMKLCDKIKWAGETISASKSRKYVDGVSSLTQQIQCNDFKGKDILIVDDICIYGGTFKGLSKMLKERNCGKLYLAVSHITIQNLGDDPITNYFDKVFTTNSKFTEHLDNKGNKLNIVKISI